MNLQKSQSGIRDKVNYGARITAFVSMVTAVLIIFAVSGCSDGGSDNPASSNDDGGGTTLPDTVFYSDVQPIFSGNCAGSSCHIGSASPGAGLLLDSRAHILAGSSGGLIKVVTAGDGANSELYKRVAGISTPRMPLNSSSLSQTNIDMIKKWIDDGLLE